MPSSMTNNPNTAQKSLRIRTPSNGKGFNPNSPHMDHSSAQTKPRSILKNRGEEPPTPVALEPDPLQSETYFQGPLRTLVASVESDLARNISVHDTTEAYILLSSRIETQAANLQDGACPAVAAIRKLRSHMICAAIRRDVAYATSGVEGTDRTTPSQGSDIEEETICVKDRSNVCHASLRFLANLFKFPALHCSFKLHELAWVFKELLDVGLSKELSTLNPHKTYSHVIGVLSYQRLPDCVFSPFLTKIATVIERAASGTMGGTVTAGPHVEGLRSIHLHLHHHGDLLFSRFHKVFKVALQNLVGPVPALRDIAAKALAAFAHAVLRGNVTIEDRLKFSSIVGAFIDKETRRAKDVHKHESNSFVLRDFLNLSENDPRIVQNATLLLNITAAFLVLSGPCVFIRPASLKFLIKAVGKTQLFRQREINLLRSATWACLVRAYSLLHVWDIPTNPEVQESAFRVVRQEYKEDVGISVIAVLLEPLTGGSRPLYRAQEAATYLYHLGQMSETRGVTAALLRRLLGGVLNDADSETCTWKDSASIVPEWLSDGSTLGMEPRKLKKMLTTVGSVDMHTVRILEADELTSSWETLTEAFQMCAVGQLFDKKTENSLQNDTLMLWQALLRVQDTLVDGFSREIISKPVLSRLAMTLCSFLDAAHAQYPIRPAQALLATHQLWKLVNDELGELWAAALASSIYRRLLKLWQREVSYGVMSNDWVQLSRSLIYVAPKRTLEVLVELHDSHAQRVIWLDMIRHVRFREHPSKDVLLQLLLFPIQASESMLKDETDYSYWDIIFLLALMHEEPEVVYTMVSEELEHALSVRSCTDLRKFFLISVCHASRSESPPNLALLSITSEYLQEAYPPENYGDNEFMELVPSLQRILEAKPGLNIIKALQKGLFPWFEDKRSNIRDIIYNNDVLPLYCDVVYAIRHISPIEDAIVELAELLTAPFSREHIPEPATGPIAFKEFWDTVGPTLDFSSRAFPSILSDCIICLSNAYSGYVPSWMESQFGSQATHASEVHSDEIVPPSVEDLESSDFSPMESKRNAEAEGNTETMKAQQMNRTSRRSDILTPAASLATAESTQQFARFQQASTTKMPAMILNLEQAKKKRKLRQLDLPGRDNESMGSSNADDPLHNPDQASRSNETAPSRPKAISGDIVLLPQQSAERQKYLQSESRTSSTELDRPSLTGRAVRERQTSPDDYATWEVGLSSQDVRELLRNDGDATPRPRNASLDVCDTLCTDSVRLHDGLHEPLQVNTEHLINRSQTAPASLISSAEAKQCSNYEPLSDDNNNTARLRRTHTTTDVPLDTLEKLHARLATETSYMQTQDLAQATRLTYDVLGLLNGRMSEKLEKRK